MNPKVQILFLIVVLVNDYVGTIVLGESRKPSLTFCVVMESNTTGKNYDYRRAAAAIDLALSYVQIELLSDYRLVKFIRLLPDECSLENYAISQAVSLIAQGVKCSVYIGPGCGLAVEILSDVAEYYDTAIIGVPAASLGISAPPSVFTTITRMSFTYAGIAMACMRFFATQNYSTPTFIVDQSINLFSEMGELTEITFQQKNFDLYSNTKFVRFDGKATDNDALERILRDANQRSRVFVIYSDAISTRRIMVFIAIDLYASPVWGKYTWQLNDTDNEVARDSFRALLLLSLMTDTRLKTNIFWEDVKKLSREKYDYIFDDSEQVDLVVIHFFDAILLFANAILAGFRDKSNISGLDFTNFITNFTFYSPLSGNITISADNDRISDFAISSFSTSTSRHDVIYGLPGQGGLIQYGTLAWFGQTQLPPNTPYCGFDGKDLICRQSRQLPAGETAAIIIIPIFFVAGICAGGFMILKRLFFIEKDPFWWRIFLSEIEPTMTSYAVSAKSVGMSTQSGKSGMLTEITEGVDYNNNTTKEVAVISGALVSIYGLPEPHRRVPKDLQGKLREIHRLQHANLQTLIGIIVNDSNYCVFVAGELCGKGSLRALIGNTKLDLDWVFKNSIMRDLANGMTYLHASKLVSHGFLTDECCLIDSRFITKISQYGLGLFQSENDRNPPNPSQIERNWRMLLYRSPELLRRQIPESGTQKGDVYSFGILMQQIILRTDPFEMTSTTDGGKLHRVQNVTEIVMEVQKGSTPPIRPTVRMNLCSAELHDIMENCWNEESIARPPFSRIRIKLLKVLGGDKDNIVDHLIRRMEVYAAELEAQAEDKMKQFMDERQRSRQLLSHILPKTVAEALLQGKSIQPETFPSTTVYFGDIHGFSEAAESLSSPTEVLGLLNRLYGIYDDILEKHDVYQVEAVSDACLVVSGLPISNGIQHVVEVASVALDVRRAVKEMNTSTVKVPNFELRVGINSDETSIEGPCVAGVVGLQLPRYCLFGDTVNTASRMESCGAAGKIHCSESTKLLLDKFSDYVTIERGAIEVKGKGTMMTYWLIGKT